MLKSIRIKNYRCFSNSSMTFKKITVVVGCNNAGKSTLIEALRMASFAARKYKTATYKDAPDSLHLPTATKGFRVAVEQLNIDLTSVVYQRQEDVNAEITVCFDSGARIVVYANERIAFACIYDDNKQMVKSKQAAGKASICPVHIMPQLGLVKEDEKLISQETTMKEMETRLSSQHFRNELLLLKDKYFEEFRYLAQKTWDGLRIDSISHEYGEQTLSLIVYDSSFAEEIGQMGSGLQMWLQMVWFISRCPKEATVILDEPDVYMHPDMQRRIMKIVREKFNQAIISTHSIEIVSDVEPKYVATLDKTTREFSYAGDLRGVQRIAESIGSTHNLSLARLGSFKKCVFVEGHDMDLLSKIFDSVYPNATLSLKDIPHVPLGGWSRFAEALGTARLLYDETDGDIETICILDRDYYPDYVLNEKKSMAAENHLELHIWDKKEIENYILMPEIILAASKLPIDKKSELINALDKAAEQYREAVTDRFAQKIMESDRSVAIPTANEQARKLVRDKWTSLEGKIALINGKDFKSDVMRILREQFKVSCSINRLIESMTYENTPEELIEVINKLIN